MLKKMGCTVRGLRFSPDSLNPLTDFFLVVKLFFHYRYYRPDIVMLYTVKLNIYGSIASQLLAIPQISTVTGLGPTFDTNNWLTSFVSALYRIALWPAEKVFFQNESNAETFASRKIVRREQIVRVTGSGVDLTHFTPERSPGSHLFQQGTNFLLIARMLWTKGIGEYVEAARLIKQEYTNVEFYLLGPSGAGNSAAVSQARIDEWMSEGLVQHLGVCDDVRPYIASASCVVLPSYYHEGLSRVLMEAAAMAVPVITTDWAGCRETVENGITGYLCQPRNAVSLHEQIKKFISLSADEQQTMGEQGRKKAEQEFDKKVVAKKYMSEMKQILFQDHKQ